MKVDGSLKSLLQGVSQQPPRDRLPGQCTDQLNMSSDPVTGLSRRPPTDLVGELLTSSNIRGWHHFETKEGSKFLTCIADGNMKVWDLNTTPKTVNVEGGLDYLTKATGTYKFGTIEDDTVVINDAVVPTMTTDTKAYYNKGAGSSPAAIVQCLGGGYGRKYSLYLDGALAASYTVPDGGVAFQSAWVTTIAIATELVRGLTEPGGPYKPLATVAPSNQGGSVGFKSGLMAGTDWTVSRKDDTILIQNNVGRTFNLTGTDSSGNIQMKVMVDTVPDTSDLPALAPQGYLARIAKETDPEKDMFVQFFVDGTNDPNRAHFSFEGVLDDEYTGTSAKNHNAATFSTTIFQEGEQSLQLARASSQSVDYRPSTPFDMTSITVSGQFKRATTATLQTLFSMSSTAYNGFANVAVKVNSSHQLVVSISSNGTTYNIANAVVVTTPLLSTSTWNKVAYRYNGTAHTLEIDDVQVYTVTGAKAAPSLGVNIGQAAGADFFDGNVDDFRVSSYVPVTTTYANGQGFGTSGFWKETVSSGSQFAIDKTTMPHILTWDADAGTFSYKRGAWEDRRTGTAVSNPNPSFIGNPINDVTAFQSRLVFLAGPNVIMSRSKHNTDFWYESSAANADTDPIDISSTASEVSTLKAVVPHNKDLVCFSKNGQFIVFGRTGLTPGNAALVLTTAFGAELQAKPAPAGRNVFFATNFGKYTGMREFYAEGSTDINDSRPITQHVNKFIVGKATRLAASSNYNVLLVQTDADKKTLYPYQYIWSDTTKVQSSWSRWVFNRDIEYVFFDEELVYLVTKVENTYHLYRMSLDVQDSEGMEYPIFLDSRFDVPDCHTQFVLPDDYQHLESLTVVQSTGCPNPGLRAAVKDITFDAGVPGYVVTLTADMEGGAVIVGSRFMSSYKPTMPSVKDQDNVVVGTGKLRIRNFLTSLRKTGHIIGQVLTKWGNGEPVEFIGRVVGSSDNIVGQPALSDDMFILPCRHKADEAEVVFYTDRHLPMTLIDVEWIGQYNKRGKRISTGQQSQ